MPKRALAAATAVVILAAVHTGAALAQDAGEPTFASRVERLSPELRERMRGSSWRRGCPVPLRELRLLTLTHWGMDGEAHRGWLVVRVYQASNVVAIMRRLFELEFPIRRMRLVDVYGGSDSRSMDANNTSAFNCRYVAGTTRWSEHAYGRAIDVNPIQNPYVSGNHVSPEAGRPYADREPVVPGMIVRGTGVVRAFSARGWGWGGNWTSAKDYQHFSATGRGGPAAMAP